MSVVISVTSSIFAITLDENSVLTKDKTDIFCKVAESNSGVVEIWETSPTESKRNIIFSSLYTNFSTPSGASASAVVLAIKTLLTT